MEENTSVQQECLQLSLEHTQIEDPNLLIKKRWFKLLLALFGSFIFGILIGLRFYFLEQKMSTIQEPLPCVSSACLRIAKHFSDATDPFSQPCDYFLLNCEANTSSISKGRQRSKITFNNDREIDDATWKMNGVGEMRMDQESDMEEMRDALPDRLPDRFTALVQSIKEILESPPRNGSLNAEKLNAQRFYKTCMDSNSSKNNSVEHVLTLIQQLGGWAITKSWTQPDFNSTLMLLMAQYDTFPFFNVYVGPDGNGSQNYIQIDQPHFLCPIEWNIQNEKSKISKQALRPFFTLCKNLLSLLNFSSAVSNQGCGLFTSLSSTLVIKTSPLDYRLSKNLLYHKITIEELQMMAPSIDWLSCLQALFHPLPISLSDFVLLHNRPYIIDLSKIISDWKLKYKNINSYPLHTYMIMTLLQTLIPALDTRFTQTMQSFSISINDRKEDVPQWKQCVLQSVKGFDTLLINLIKEQYATKEAEELIRDIYYSFKTKVASLKWRDEKTQDLVLNKVNYLMPRLSTKNENFSMSQPHQDHKEVIMSEKDYFFNYLQLLVLQQKWRRNLLSYFQHTVLSITPFVSGKDIIIPVGMFASPLFHSSYPRAVNFGILGTMIAKDLLHLLLPNVFSQSENPGLESMCMSHYLKVKNGISDLSTSQQQELWLQYSALHISVQSYIRSLRNNSSDTSVSGFSHIHLFLTSFSQTRCNNDPYNPFMPFGHSFLVTMLCARSVVCPKPVICVEGFEENPLPLC